MAVAAAATVAVAVCAVANEPAGPFPSPGAPNFKKGVGGGGDCGDLDAPHGLDTVSWW